MPDIDAHETAMASTVTRKAGGLNFQPVAEKSKSTSVLSLSNLHPGAKHPVCFARIKL